MSPLKDLEARKAYDRAYHQKHDKFRKDQRRERDLLKKYGITLTKYNELLKAQKGRCASCGADRSDQRVATLHVDHCHSTGKVRGLLCTNCNQGIGKLGDNVSGLLDAVHYLLQSEPTLFPGIWKRIPPQTVGLTSTPSDLETPNACLGSKSSKGTITSVSTVEANPISLSTT